MADPAPTPPAPPAPGATPPATPPAPPATPPAGPWYGEVDADTKGFIDSKGWAGLPDAITSYRNLEKLTGVPAEQIIRLPKADDKAGWDGVYAKLGRPATPDEYKLPLNAGDNGEFAKTVSTWFHEAGIGTKQAQTIAEKWNAYVAEKQAALQDERKAAYEADVKQLRKLWGLAIEKNENIVNRVAAKFGLEDKVLDSLRESMGIVGAMTFLHDIGVKLGEDKHVSGTGPGGFGNAMTPDAAKARIASLRADPGFAQKYIAGDAEARAEMKRLHEMAFPEQTAF